MKIWIYIAALTFTLVSNAKTLEDLRTELDAVDGVEYAVIKMENETPELKTIAPYPGWAIAQISYLQITGDAIADNTVAVMVNTKTGEAFWSNRAPSVLPPKQVEEVGTDKEILTAVGGNIVKAEIQRSASVGDVPPSATVVGYREIDGKTIEFKVVVYSKGGVLVSDEPTAAAVAAK